MRSRAWGWLLLVPVTLSLLVVALAPFRSFHQHLALAGTPDRFAATVVRAGRSDARAALWLDNVFVLSWVLIVPSLLTAGLRRWAPERRRLATIWMRAPRVALFAAAFDLAQNVLALAMVGKRQPATGLTLTLVSVTWVMWLLFIWSFLALFALVVGPLVAPVLRPALRRVFATLDGMAGSHPPIDMMPAEAMSAGAEAVGPTIGVCVSGGGIRASSVSLGALRAMDAPRADGPSMFLRSRWLVAVSGGAYTAGGWRISRRPGNTMVPAATAAGDGAFDAGHPWAATVRERRRFLDNGMLSILGGVFNVIVRSMSVLGGLAALLYLVGRVLGRAIRTRSIHPSCPVTDAALDQALDWRHLVPARLVAPGAVLLMIAFGLAVVSATQGPQSGRRRWSRPAQLAAVAGGGLIVLLVGVPTGIVYGRRLLTDLPLGGSAEASAGVLGALTSLGFASAVVGVLVAQLKRRWMHLGGVLLAVASVLFAGKVADTFAYGYAGIWSHGLFTIIAVVWLLVLESIAAHRLTLGGLYRKRLAATFATGGGDSPPLPPLPYGDEPHWAAYASTSGPELIVCATAHATAPTFCRLPAYGFTFRADRITLHDRTDGSSARVASADYPRGSWWDGYPRGWIVSRSMALSGAAFASAMGRQGLGTTNAPLVALNLRLGAWVPNPRFTHWFADPHTSPRVHLGYLVKELFNRYDPERDAFVYVADGGHRENLGLVELLRERPDVVFCVDASGDPPQSFQTLAEAIELARVELDVDVNIDLRAVTLSDRAALPLDCAVEGLIEYPASLGGGTGRLIYGRSQLSEEADPALLRHRAVDERFPDYSTLDQFLTEVEYDNLVALGHHVGERMVQLYETGNSIQDCV